VNTVPIAIWRDAEERTAPVPVLPGRPVSTPLEGLGGSFTGEGDAARPPLTEEHFPVC
jgi:hypothetical protein